MPEKKEYILPDAIIVKELQKQAKEYKGDVQVVYKITEDEKELFA